MAVDHELLTLDPAARSETRQIGAGAGLGEALTPDDVPRQNLRQMKRLLLRGAAGDQRWARVIQPDEGCIERRWRSGPRILLEPDNLLEHGQTPASYILRPGN